MKDKKVVDRVKVKITVLTPVHIGNGERYKKGTNFVQVDGTWYFIDIDKLIDKHWEALYNKLQGHQAQSITSILKFAEELVHNGQIGNWAIPLDNPIYGTDGTDVLPHIKNKLTEKPIIPGSSIKGALRTVLMWKLANQVFSQWLQSKRKLDVCRDQKACKDKDTNKNKTYKSKNKYYVDFIRAFLRQNNISEDLDDDIVGKYGEALTRHFKIGDVVFEDAEWWNSKICGVDKYNTLKWKNKPRGSYEYKFYPHSFTTIVECVPIDAKSEVAWGVDLENNLWNREGDSEIVALLGERWKKLFGNTRSAKEFWITMFKYCNEWMQEYLIKEREFFNDGFNERWSAEYIEEIWNPPDGYLGNGPSEIRFLLDELDKCIKNGNACLLRLGWGSGFHAMTGDWQYADHLEPLKHKGKVKFKTRRILFRKREGDYQFTLPGFVKIELL